MRRLAHKMLERLPLEFRVLYRQFLLRVVDLEALSIEADIPQFLGQFAGVLILISVTQTMGFLWMVGRPGVSSAALAIFAIDKVLSFVAGTMLIVGLVTVVSWDAVFPDRGDALVLGPLPVTPRTIMAAKTAASGALLIIALVALNFGVGIVIPLVMGGSILGFLRGLFAWWVGMVAATIFLYGAVAAVQGWTALLLPRGGFLRLSALLQLAAFALFLTAWIYQPSFSSLEGTAREFAGRWPACWFLCLILQLDGRLPAADAWLAHRAWIGVGLSTAGAGTSLVFCYFRIMKKTVEQPDLLPGGRRRRLPMRWGNSLQMAIVQFSIRSLARSRHHRVVYAFFLAISFAIAVSTVESAVRAHAARPITPEFLMATLIMMCLAIVGLRSIFSLPVSLKANWVLQVTQLRPSERYIAATRRALLVMSAIPVWLIAAALSLCFRPWHAVAEHLFLLALMGSILADLSLLHVSRIPFACSYLPGKSNIQFRFWGFVVVFLPIAMQTAKYEAGALRHAGQFALLAAILAMLAAGLRAFNRRAAKSAVLYYEDSEPEVITTLGIGSYPMLHDELQSAQRKA